MVGLPGSRTRTTRRSGENKGILKNVKFQRAKRIQISICGGRSQVVKAFDCESDMREFDPRRSPK